jgi:cytochrome b pre-mRNA-processing protein 3
MIVARWRARRANRILIDQIHGEIVAAARAPALYTRLAVADSVDGRFEMVALHAGLALRRLAELGDLGCQVAQDLVDGVFRGFEDALREMSYGDVGVARRMKKMAEAFYGRGRAYGEALAAGDADALAAALARNVYGARDADSAPQARALAAYVAAAAAALERVEIERFVGGDFRFPNLIGEAR